MVTQVTSSERMVSEINPNVEYALRNAQNFRMSGDYQSALNVYNEIINSDPSNSRALHQKADVLDCMGNYEEAIRCYDSALDCDPYNAEVWYNKGITLEKIGKHEAGLAHIQKGISLSIGDF